MKHIILVSILSLIMPLSAHETKQVCINKEVNGKITQVCKDVKIHKKLEGTKVPEKNK